MLRHPPAGFRGDFHSGPEGLGRWATASGPWEVPPAAVARPRDTGDVVRIVHLARDAGSSIIPRGAGTGMPGGNVGRGIVLDLGHPDLAFIDPPNREAGTIRVGPGAVAAQVDAVAAAAGLRLPALPSSADRCTVGGMVGTNAAGARSFRHGAFREWVVDLEVVFADGSVQTVTPATRGLSALATLARSGTLSGPGGDGLIRDWPGVRKNSSGYALDRFLPEGDPVQLLVGSEGTLGVTTAITLRLAPRPEARAVILLPLPHPDLLPEGGRIAGRRGATTCEFLGRRLLELVEAAGHRLPGPTEHPEAILLLEVEGGGEEVAEASGAIRDDARKVGLRSLEATTPGEMARLWGLRHQASPLIQAMAQRGLRSIQVIEDSVVPPARLPEYLEGVRGILSSREMDHVTFGHAGDGNAHVNLLVDLSAPRTLSNLREILVETTTLVRSLGGTLSGEHGDGRLRAPLLEAIWPPHLVEAFRAVKRAFDPESILNPGVVLPLPGQDALEGLAGMVDAVSP